MTDSPQPATRQAAPERLRKRIGEPTPDGCWPWIGRLNRDGYGTLNTKYAHRLVYGHFVGTIPDGLEIDHMCRVHHCVNPAHLEPVTKWENMIRGESFAARKARQTHCIHGHPLSGDNLYVIPSGPNAGSRNCITCMRRRGRDRDEKRRQRRLASQ